MLNSVAPQQECSGFNLGGLELFYVEVSFFLSPPLSLSFGKCQFSIRISALRRVACLPMLPRRLVYGIAHVPSTGTCLKVFIHPAHLQVEGLIWGNSPCSYDLDGIWLPSKRLSSPGTGSSAHSVPETLSTGEAVKENHRLTFPC